MGKLREKLPVIAVFLALGIIMSSCGVSQGQGQLSNRTTGTDQTKTELKLITSWGGVDSKAEALKEVLSRFTKENPGIEVVNQSLFGEDFLPKIKTDFASGNDPDVFGMWPGSDIRALIGAGKVADLTGLLQSEPQWKDTFKSSMWAYTTYDGKTYGLPVEIIFEGLFINKDLFERYNVRVPVYFGELKQAVRIFKEKGITPIAYNSQAEGSFLYQNMVAMLGGRWDTENPIENNRIRKCYLDAMAYVKELYAIGAFPANYFSLTNNERNSLFKEKKAAMIVQGSWFIGDFAEEDRTVEIIPFPYIEEGKAPPTTMIYGLGNGVFHMSAHAAADPMRKEAAVKLLKVLTSPETASYFAAKTGMMSNVIFDGQQIAYKRLTKQGRLLLNNARQLIGPPDSFVDRSAWEEVISGKFPYYLEGRMEAEEIWNLYFRRLEQ